MQLIIGFIALFLVFAFSMSWVWRNASGGKRNIFVFLVYSLVVTIVIYFGLSLFLGVIWVILYFGVLIRDALMWAIESLWSPIRLLF